MCKTTLVLVNYGYKLQLNCSVHFQMTRMVTALALFEKAYLMAKLSQTVKPIMWRGLTNTFKKISFKSLEKKMAMLAIPMLIL